MNDLKSIDFNALTHNIKRWGQALGFQQVGVADCDLSVAEGHLLQWLEKGWHGDMDYMARHGLIRSRPQNLLPGTLRIISVRMNYRPEKWRTVDEIEANPERANVAMYALGRDYHKVLRQRLQVLSARISQAIGDFQYRVFTDSAPVMEVELARKAGVGWRGKHTLLINREVGSYFFLGEIYTDLPLPVDAPVTEHCGSCQKCLDVCPTGAIVAPYQLDARRCISYLTIELKGSIPVPLRPLIGNRVYGCDDCQLVCPWNRFSEVSEEKDFMVRNGLDDVMLIELFQWSESDFHTNLAGSAIRRIGFERWSRNLAVGLGNALRKVKGLTHREKIRVALQARLQDESALVREHVQWALAQEEGKESGK
jgi:epoxyqueuosine reductase